MRLLKGFRAELLKRGEKEINGNAIFLLLGFRAELLREKKDIREHADVYFFVRLPRRAVAAGN